MEVVEFDEGIVKVPRGKQTQKPDMRVPKVFDVRNTFDSGDHVGIQTNTHRDLTVKI